MSPFSSLSLVCIHFLSFISFSYRVGFVSYSLMHVIQVSNEESTPWALHPSTPPLVYMVSHPWGGCLCSCAMIIKGLQGQGPKRPKGWTLHWTPKWRAWVTMTLNPLYTRSLQRKTNVYILLDSCIYTKLFKCMQKMAPLDIQNINC